MYDIIIGDALDVLDGWRGERFRCCITSPPYWGLRNYDAAGQIGLDDKFDDYLSKLVGVFLRVADTLTEDGSIWIVIGDVYNSSPSNYQDGTVRRVNYRYAYDSVGRQRRSVDGLKVKDLIGMPAALAFRLADAGLTWTGDYIWYKPNARPESTKDRPPNNFEHILVFSNGASHTRPRWWPGGIATLNTRSSLMAAPWRGDGHFASYPPDLVAQILLENTERGDWVLDPFLGTGTTAAVAVEYGRNAVGVEINGAYAKMAIERIESTPVRLID